VSSRRFAALWAPPLAKTFAKKAGIAATAAIPVKPLADGERYASPMSLPFPGARHGGRARPSLHLPVDYRRSPKLIGA